MCIPQQKYNAKYSQIILYLEIQDCSVNKTVIPIQANYGVTSSPHSFQRLC